MSGTFLIQIDFFHIIICECPHGREVAKLEPDGVPYLILPIAVGHIQHQVVRAGPQHNDAGVHRGGGLQIEVLLAQGTHGLVAAGPSVYKGACGRRKPPPPTVTIVHMALPDVAQVGHQDDLMALVLAQGLVAHGLDGSQVRIEGGGAPAPLSLPHFLSDD